MFALVIASVGGVLARALYTHHYVPPGEPLSAMNANDLHGIHDLLTVGVAGVFLLDGDRAPVVAAAERLARLLPKLHPVDKCRREIAEALEHPLLEDHVGRAPPAVAAAARASWECLPAKFDADSFGGFPFTGDRVGNETLEKQSRRPHIKDRSLLGACAKTSWDRACSFWVSLHALAARADARGLSDAFIDATFTLIAGGATQCAACTNHFRLVHKRDYRDKTPLTDSVVTELGYCANIQCSRAQQHVVPLVDCVTHPKRACQTPALDLERTDISAFREWRRTRASANAFDTFVVLHNMITESVLTGDLKRYECADAAYDALPVALVDVPRPRPPRPSPPFPGDARLPGIGPHRTLAC